MKIEKAIELNKEAVTSLKQGKRPDHADAVTLGIDALKAVQRFRQGYPINVYSLLPGETKD